LEPGGPQPGGLEPGPAEPGRPPELTGAPEPIHPIYPSAPFRSAEHPVGHVYGSPVTMGLPSARGGLGPDEEESDNGARAGRVTPS
jgi:hypothetical protein